MKEWKMEEHQEKSAPELSGDAKKAASRALKLLLYKMRSEKELLDRLVEEEFSREDAEAAIAYCKSFGYVNDQKYAENYVASMKARKSHQVIRRELSEKGISSEIIEIAFDEMPYDESEMIGELIRKKNGQPHKLDDKELRRTFGFLARKGFSTSLIWKMIGQYQDGADIIEE